jgi:uncharacterized protein (TIRG00374 family)
MKPNAKQKKRRPPWLKFVLHAAVLLGLIWAGMKYVDGGEFKRALHEFRWINAPLILALGAGSLFLKGWRFSWLLREVAQVNRWVVMRGYIAAQAATLLPGGIAARAAILDQAGVPAGKSGAAIAQSSLSDQAVLLICALASGLWFESARRPAQVLLGVLIVISLLLGIEAARSWLIDAGRWVARRLKVENLWEEFLTSLREMMDFRTWLSSLGNAALALALLVLALHFSIEGIGAHVTPATEILACALPSLLGRISAMPGGFGVTEAGMVGVLDAAPGIVRADAAAAVLIFRLGTILFNALIGAIVYFLAWDGESEKKAMLQPE